MTLVKFEARLTAVNPLLETGDAIRGRGLTVPDRRAFELVGGKFNLTDVAARVGLGQLQRLDEFNAERRSIEKLVLDAYLLQGDDTGL